MKEKFSDLLLNIARDPLVELFHDQSGTTYATFPVRGHRETAKVRSLAFRQWLGFACFKMVGTVPSDSVFASAIPTIEAIARFEGAEHNTHVRIARVDDYIFVDLGCPRWRAVKISKAGVTIEDTPPVKFVRFPGFLQIPGLAASGSFEDLQNFTTLRGEAFDLLRGFCIGSLIEGIPYPILSLTGEQGSTKSTLTRLIKTMLDPAMPAYTSLPADERDLLIAAQHAHIIALDNLSRIPGWLSDSLCRLATGGGLRTRMLYSNDDEFLHQAQRPVVVNSIASIVSQADLQDRSIAIEVPPLPDNKKVDESSFWANFTKAQPQILRGLFDAVSRGLQKPEPRVKFAVRMQDFTKFVYRCEPTPGAFARAWEGNRSESNRTLVDFSPVAEAVFKLVPEGGSWRGSFTELYESLTGLASPSALRNLEWPKSPRGLGAVLKKLAPALRREGVGIEPEPREGGSGRRMVKITRFQKPMFTCSQTEGTETSQVVQNEEDAANFKLVNICEHVNVAGASCEDYSERSQTMFTKQTLQNQDDSENCEHVNIENQNFEECEPEEGDFGLVMDFRKDGK